MKNETPKLLRVGKAAHELGLHPLTVRRWIKAGKLQAVHVGWEARVPRAEIERLLGQANARLVVLYGRVSGPDQRADLDTQLATLRRWAAAERPGRETLVLSDIGSGLNASRKHLQRLLQLVGEDRVGEVVVTYPDRLTRFGLEYLITWFESYGVKLIVLEPAGDKPPEQELTEDLLALIAAFAGRLYGLRSRKQQELVRCAEQVLKQP